MADGINLARLFPQDLLQEKDNVQLRVFNYILYGNGKSIRGIYHTSIQLVRTCLVLNWDQEKNGSIEEVHASFVEVRANDLIRDFLRIELVKSTTSYTGKRYDAAGSGLIPDNRLDRTNINPFFSKGKIRSFTQQQGTIGTLLNRNKECQSLRILSSFNCSRVSPFNSSKYNDVTTRLDPVNSKRYWVGPLGTIVPKIVNFYSSFHLITHNQILLNKYLKIDYFKQTSQVLKVFHCYIIFENKRIYTGDGLILTPLYLYGYFIEINFWEETSAIMNLGQFLCENICLFQDGSYIKKSGQILIIHVASLVIRSAKPYLATPGATVHGHYGETL